MRRATTPIHTFTFPEALSAYDQIEIVYAQNGEKIVTKHKSDLEVVATNKGAIQLTQSETIAFSGSSVMIQIRVKQGDIVKATEISIIRLGSTLSEVVL